MAKSKVELTPEQKAAKVAEANAAKAANFTRLAEMRVGKALSAIAVIGNLANKATYSYTPEQAQQIVDALDKELSILANRFSKTEDTKAKGGFSFATAPAPVAGSDTVAG